MIFMMHQDPLLLAIESIESTGVTELSELKETTDEEPLRQPPQILIATYLVRKQRNPLSR